jgi:hypothetical protein
MMTVMQSARAAVHYEEELGRPSSKTNGGNYRGLSDPR